MEEENKKKILKLLNRSKALDITLLVSLVLSVALFSLGIIVSKTKVVEPTVASQNTEIGSYVKMKPVVLTGAYADYGSDDEVADRYYLAQDGYALDSGNMALYIINMSDWDYDVIASKIEDRSDEIEIKGIAESIPSDLIDITVDVYNEIFPDDKITVEQFPEHFVTYLINAKRSPNAAVGYFVFAYMACFIAIFLGIVKSVNYLKSKNNISKFSKNNDLTSVILQYQENTKKEYDKLKVIMLEDYIITYGGAINIIAIKDIVWMYKMEHYYNGILTNIGIVIVQKDNRRQEIAIAYNSSKNSVKEQQDEIFARIMEKRPNILIGASKENKEAMNKENREKTIAQIEEKESEQE